MSQAVIPAPVRFDAVQGSEFAIRPGTAVWYPDTGLAPVVERFRSQVTRRTGLLLAPAAGHPAPDEASVTIELATAAPPGRRRAQGLGRPSARQLGWPP